MEGGKYQYYKHRFLFRLQFQTNLFRWEYQQIVLHTLVLRKTKYFSEFLIKCLKFPRIKLKILLIYGRQ